MRFLIVVEKAKSGYSAYSPDLPGCVAAGSTRQRTISRMNSAIRFHLEGMRAEGQRVPAPRSYSTYIEIPA
jgi:predicted RNase H-like HicB family nuclease